MAGARVIRRARVEGVVERLYWGRSLASPSPVSVYVRRVAGDLVTVVVAGREHRFAANLSTGDRVVARGDLWFQPGGYPTMYATSIRLAPQPRDVMRATMHSLKNEYWTVSGTPPKITVAPSIFCEPPHGWHGFIRDGVLEPA